MPNDNEREHIERASFLNKVSEDVLFLLPLGAGEKLLAIADENHPVEKQWAAWFRRVLAWNAEELCDWMKAEGDECDQITYLNVFLWKQRHGVFSKSLRPSCALGEDTRPLTYCIHRYMVVMGYEGLLEGDDPYTEVNFNYIQEIERLLGQWRTPDFGAVLSDFEDLTLLLSVAGPQASRYGWNAEAKQFVEYIVANTANDPRLSGFAQCGVGLSSLMLLMLDFDLSPDDTFPFVKWLLTSYGRVHLGYLPALIAGLEMYGDKIIEVLGQIEVQSGLDSFLSLLTE